MSYLQIYQEKIYDLLANGNDKIDLTIREHPKTGQCYTRSRMCKALTTCCSRSRMCKALATCYSRSRMCKALTTLPKVFTVKKLGPIIRFSVSFPPCIWIRDKDMDQGNVIFRQLRCGNWPNWKKQIAKWKWANFYTEVMVMVIFHEALLRHFGAKTNSNYMVI